jgi:hypothetical protein
MRALIEPRGTIAKSFDANYIAVLCGLKKTTPHLHTGETELSWCIDRKDAAAASCKQQTNQACSGVVRYVVRMRTFYET